MEVERERKSEKAKERAKERGRERERKRKSTWRENGGSKKPTSIK